MGKGPKLHFNTLAPAIGHYGVSGQRGIRIHNKGIAGSMVQRMTPNGRPFQGKRGVGMYTRISGKKMRMFGPAKRWYIFDWIPKI